MPHKTLKIWRIWYSREKYIATPNRGQVVWIQNNTLDSDLHDPILIKQECAGSAGLLPALPATTLQNTMFFLLYLCTAVGR